MLERNRTPVSDARSFPEWSLEGEFIGLSDILLFLRVHLLSIVLFAFLGVAAGAFYVVTSDKIYTARTQILIEPKFPQLLQQQAAEVNLSLDTSQVETQLAVLRSEKIAMMVIDKLNLTDHPEFRELSGTTLSERMWRLSVFLSRMIGLGGDNLAEPETGGAEEDGPPAASAPEPEFEIRRRAIDTFNQGLSVNRVGVSYAIDIFFRARDPELTAQVANATADAFVQEQLETRTKAASEGLRWLEERIKQVRTQMNQAVQIAQEFRASHDYRIGSRFDGAVGGPSGQTLEELEVTADTYRKMYESLLAAFTSSVDQKPYLIADARVITTATRPLGQSHPRKSLALAFGLTAGLMVGIGLALARYLLDRTIRSPSQVHEQLGMECIGELPMVWFQRGGFGGLDEVLRHDKSTFTKNLRSARAAIAVADVAQPVRTIGITSALPGDGKSTVASNLATLYAQSGLRTLLIDADLHHAVLTKNFALPPWELEGSENVPTGAKISAVEGQIFELMSSSFTELRNLLAPDAMKKVLEETACYDMVIVDLPSFASDASGLEVAPMFDGVVVVAEWGRTPLDLLAEFSQALRSTRVSVIGVLLTKVRVLSTHRHRKRMFQVPR